MNSHINKKIKFSMTAILLSVCSAIAAPVLATDASKGKALHDAKCTGCHDTRQYTRKNRIVHTYEDLHARVEFCDSASNAEFEPNDIDDVVTYLNNEFYKFKK